MKKPTEDEIIAALGNAAVVVHDTLKTGAEALNEACDLLDDPVLSQATHWAAVALAYSHVTFCGRAKELVLEKIAETN